MKMSILENLSVAIRDYIKPYSTPVCISFLQEDDEVPAKAKKPAQFFGYRLGLCQGVSFARKYGWSMVFTAKDIGCGPCLSYFGFVERPEFEVEGGLVHPLYTKTLEQGKKSEDAIDKLPVGTIAKILVEPLDRATRQPDMVLIYGNAAQMARLIQGALFNQGGAIYPKFCGRCACSPEMVTPYLTGEYNVSIPDGGERMFALTTDEELVFTVPFAKIEDLIDGITTTHKSGIARYPFPIYGLRMEPKFPDHYYQIVDLTKDEDE